MNAEREPIPVLNTKPRPRPNDYPCKPGTAPGHAMVAEPRPFAGGPLIRVCRYCGLRYQVGVGVVG